MPNELEPVAKRKEGNLVEYVCPLCGGWDALCEVYHEFLLFIDHLIRDLCIVEDPRLNRPVVVGNDVWFVNPGKNEVICGLPAYHPNSPRWKELLEKGQKIPPQARFFLPDIADWLEKALVPIEGLSSIEKSDLFAADQLFRFVQALPPEFQEQREYLLKYEERLKDTGTDPKWLGTPGRQAGFVAHSMAGARWGLTTSTSREMIRQTNPTLRREALRTIRIQERGRWWEP
jgi:hypothetical protein